MRKSAQKRASAFCVQIIALKIYKTGADWPVGEEDGSKSALQLRTDDRRAGSEIMRIRSKRGKSKREIRPNLYSLPVDRALRDWNPTRPVPLPEQSVSVQLTALCGPRSFNASQRLVESQAKVKDGRQSVPFKRTSAAQIKWTIFIYPRGKIGGFSANMVNPERKKIKKGKIHILVYPHAKIAKKKIRGSPANYFDLFLARSPRQSWTRVSPMQDVLYNLVEWNHDPHGGSCPCHARTGAGEEPSHAALPVERLQDDLQKPWFILGMKHAWFSTYLSTKSTWSDSVGGYPVDINATWYGDDKLLPGRFISMEHGAWFLSDFSTAFRWSNSMGSNHMNNWALGTARRAVLRVNIHGWGWNKIAYRDQIG